MSSSPVPLRLRALRTAFRVVDPLAPRLSRRWAQRLFTTPPRHRPPDAERRVVAAGRGFTFQHDGRSLRGWLWGEGPKVLLLHGWGGRGGQLHAFVQPLVEAGFCAVAIDLPGHGRSEGRTTNLIDCAAAVAALARVAGPFHGVIGHSFGGAIAAFAHGQGLPFRGAVLIAAPSAPEQFYRELLETLGFDRGRHDGLVRAFEADIGFAFRDVQVTAPGFRPKAPALVIHDEEDREVPAHHGRRIAQSWPGARLHLTRGLGHRRLLKDPAVVAAAIAFLAAGA